MLTLSLLAALALAAPAQEVAPETTQDTPSATPRYPASTALAEGVSPDALGKLDAFVQSLVDDEEIVGAELLVIKNGRSILHESYGWRDREAEVPMVNGSVFCVRSMTKPLIGAAVLMLVDDRQLKLDDRIAEYLPAFEAESTREITIQQLLNHTSGLPMSLILAKDLRELDGIQAVADLGAGYELEFEPGTAFNYSDQGTDTLTALVEVVSGMPVAEFVSTRVLEPLGMQNSACVMTEGHALRERGCAKYIGSRGSWTRFWGTDDQPLFPFFLGSQGLYSTVEDYALFMDMWRNRGRAADRERLLASRYVRTALKPGPHAMSGPTGLPGLRADYGCLMQLWTGEAEEGEREVVAYGHTGSDGTHAWVFPEQNALVLYFTQSRNNMTGLQVEEVLGELFLGVPFDANQAAPPFEQYLGYYWEGPGDMYRGIIRDGDDLALEILDKTVVPLTYIGEDRWKLRPNPSIVLEFDRSDDGVVTGYHIGDHMEYRFDPADDLPDADELAARVREAHGIHLLETLGPLRTRGTLVFDKLDLEGQTEALIAYPDRFCWEFTSGELFERSSFDGERAWYADPTHPAAVLEGARASMVRLDSSLARFGDWRRWYPDVQVIQRLEKPGGTVLLVRMGDTSAPAATLGIDEQTARVVGEMSLIESGVGRMAKRVQYGDFRDVSGMLLPFRSNIKFASPLLGTAVLTIEEFELGVELDEGVFELGE